MHETRTAEGGVIRRVIDGRRLTEIDRWEYGKGQLERVEQDADRNGRVDRWVTCDGRILMSTAVDADGDGRPDAPPAP